MSEFVLHRKNLPENLDTSKEFVLSDNRMEHDFAPNFIYLEEDVKKFIRKGKEETCYPLRDKISPEQWNLFWEVLDKLAGEKLC